MTLALMTGLLAAMSAVAMLEPPGPDFEALEVQLWVAEVDASLAVLSPAYTDRRALLVAVVDLRVRRETLAVPGALRGLRTALDWNEPLLRAA